MIMSITRVNNNNRETGETKNKAKRKTRFAKKEKFLLDQKLTINITISS